MLESDRRLICPGYVQVVAAGSVGDDKPLIVAKCRSFTLQQGPYMIQTCRVQVWIAAEQLSELIVLIRRDNEDKVSGQHREYRPDDAVADLPQIVVSPRLRKHRKGDNVARTRPQLVRICKGIGPRHYSRLALLSQTNRTN
jgi:hypothetical protein